MIPVMETPRSKSLHAFNDAPLSMDSGFGGLEGDALQLVERRYTDRGLHVARERYTSRNDAGDIVCKIGRAHV